MASERVEARLLRVTAALDAWEDTDH
jgi:hypothetical protein